MSAEALSRVWGFLKGIRWTVWHYYLRWPAPLWRLRGYANLRICGRTVRFHLSGTYQIAVAREFVEGRWETGVLRFVEKILEPGDVFLDIGASTGPYTIVAAQLVQPDGSVHAFEPDPVARRLLERNVAANGLKNVRVVPQGVSDRDGICWLEAPRLGIGLTRTTQERGGVEVPTVTLKTYLRDSGIGPTVVKIDVEGAEAGIFEAGFEELRQVRVILLEFHERLLRASAVDPNEFFRSLFGLGKRIYLLDGKTVTKAPPGAELGPEDSLLGNVHLALLDPTIAFTP